MAFKNNATIPFSVHGDKTGELWIGDFEVKIHLSQADDLARERMLKELLGPTPDHSSVQAQNQAEALSQLAVRILKGPPWWHDSRRGFDLIDDNVLFKLYEGVMQVYLDDISAKQKKAEAVQKSLKEGITSTPA